VRKQSWLVVVAAAASITACSRKEAAQQPPLQHESSGVVENQLLVLTKPSFNASHYPSFTFETLSPTFGIYRIRGENAHSQAVIDVLQRTGDFEIVERNHTVHHTREPADKLWMSMWDLKNYGQDIPNGVQGRAGSDIKAVEAWQYLKTKGTTPPADPILVAVIDTGLDVSHPDMGGVAGSIRVNEAEKKGKPGEDDDGNGYADDVYGWNCVSKGNATLYHGQPGSPEVADDHGHGTHVSGTIAAVGDNAEGIAGIAMSAAYNVKIMPVKFLDSNGSGEEGDEICALEYALKNKADVINASYGGGGKSQIIEYFMKKLGENGTLFVAAAGNESAYLDEQPSYPASYTSPSLITVAATDSQDQMASFSNYSATLVDVAAPGVAITSTFPVELAKKDADPNPYRTWSGTSMATPHVVGAAAMALYAHPELRRKPADLKRAIMESADWLPQLAGRVRSGGRLNLLNLVKGEFANVAMKSEKWPEVACDLQTPRYPTEHQNYTWSISIPKARAFQLHVAMARVDSAFDAATLFDQFYRILTPIGPLADTWLPVSVGEKAYLKFDNGIVVVQKYLGTKEVDDPSKVMDGENAPICIKSSDKYTCYMYAKPSDPIANFRSEGITIDRVRVDADTPPTSCKVESAAGVVL
jgi:hypothetical protein